MQIEEAVSKRLRSLIDQGNKLRIGDLSGIAVSEQHMYECVAWFAPAQNIIQIICPDPNSIYHSTSREIAKSGVKAGWYAHQMVGGLTDLLSHLLVDIDSGLLSSLVDQARAETFDDFLNHAQKYLSQRKKNEAGVIAGVVFEDTIRRICDKNSIPQNGESLENLINAIVKAGIISPLKAKRAKASAHVRTKATHAQWDEFEVDDVDATITFTRELILSQIEG